MLKTKEAVSMWLYTPNSAVACGDLASPSARSYNKRVSGYVPSALRQNSSLRLELRILASR